MCAGTHAKLEKCKRKPHLTALLGNLICVGAKNVNGPGTQLVLNKVRGLRQAGGTVP